VKVCLFVTNLKENFTNKFHYLERAHQARIKRLTEAFNVFDQESNNQIPSTELGTVVRSLGLVPTEGELQDLLSEVILS